ncbi:glycoside hydrolase family 18 protein [Deinococcus altitudinis]|uniref:glycoside hydrolase family 18 protein n=1 Tax=Deinococcus altitudinis TaxID=468914 RepID=UPI003891BB2D
MLLAQTPDLAASSQQPALQRTPLSASQKAAQRWLTGYVAGYERDLLPLGELDWSTMTDVTVARVVPLPDGRLDATFDIDPVGGPLWAAAVVRAAHAHGLRAALMVGGAGTHDAFVAAAKPAHQGAFVAALLNLATKGGFDGVDLDWEPLERADEPGLLALAQRLKRERPGLTLSLPLGYVNANFPSEEARPSLAKLARVFDRINIMSYDMAGDDEGWASWHSAALRGDTESTPTSVQSSVNAYLAAGIPARKLGLGVGFFGQCFQGVSAPRQTPAGFHIVASDGDMSYANIVRDYLKPVLRHWDAVAGVPYLGALNLSSQARLGPKKCSYVSYDDERSVALKAEYARQHGLGGMIVWTVAQGHLSGSGGHDPLLKAMRAKF